MSSLLCAWAKVDESAREQYASHVASVATRLSTRAWHFEAEKEPAFEFENTEQENVFTMYADLVSMYYAVSLLANSLPRT
jgi:hypothetical protein